MNARPLTLTILIMLLSTGCAGTAGASTQFAGAGPGGAGPEPLYAPQARKQPAAPDEPQVAVIRPGDQGGPAGAAAPDNWARGIDMPKPPKPPKPPEPPEAPKPPEPPKPPLLPKPPRP